MTLTPLISHSQTRCFRAKVDRQSVFAELMICRATSRIIHESLISPLCAAGGWRFVDV